MRQGELFHGLRLLPNAWAVVRVDGRSFSRFTASHFQKPFDRAFHEAMVEAARSLLEELQGAFAVTHSDEISVCLRPSWSLWDREVEKLVSLSAGIASAAFTLAVQKRAHFDGRVWMAATSEEVVDYFRWRQSDASRCALSGACYWALRNEGLDEAQAEAQLKRRSVAEKNELLYQRGINFNEFPGWQKRGVALVWERYAKPGVNPRTGAEVTTERRRVAVVDELPMKDEYSAWLRAQLAG